jgi:hypothetical protein
VEANLFGSSGFPLFQLLSDAGNDTETILEGKSNLKKTKIEDCYKLLRNNLAVNVACMLLMRKIILFLAKFQTVKEKAKMIQ